MWKNIVIFILINEKISYYIIVNHYSYYNIMKIGKNIGTRKNKKCINKTCKKSYQMKKGGNSKIEVLVYPSIIKKNGTSKLKTKVNVDDNPNFGTMFMHVDEFLALIADKSNAPKNYYIKKFEINETSGKKDDLIDRVLHR